MTRRSGAWYLLFMLANASAWAADGQTLFNDTCALCHQKGGIGSPGLAPPLVDKALFGRLGPQASRYIAGVMLAGMSGTLEIDGFRYTGLVMPSQARLTDADLAAIGTYVLATLNGSSTAVSPATVAELRATPMSHATLRELRNRVKP